MMKDVTILDFDDMEKIRHDIDHMIDMAKSGAYMELDGKTACEWLIEDLKSFRRQFE